MQKKSAHKPSASSGELISNFSSIKRVGQFLVPLYGMLVHHRVTLCIYFLFYLGGKRHCVPKNTTQGPRRGIKPALLNPGSSALVMPRVDYVSVVAIV